MNGPRPLRQARPTQWHHCLLQLKITLRYSPYMWLWLGLHKGYIVSWDPALRLSPRWQRLPAGSSPLDARKPRGPRRAGKRSRNVTRMFTGSGEGWGRIRTHEGGWRCGPGAANHHVSQSAGGIPMEIWLLISASDYADAAGKSRLIKVTRSHWQPPDWLGLRLAVHLIHNAMTVKKNTISETY